MNESTKDDTLTPLGRRLVERAPAHGFPLAGVLDLAAARGALSPHVARYEAFLSAGRHGDMHYLARGRDRRADPALVFENARGVLCVAVPYGPDVDENLGAQASRLLRNHPLPDGRGSDRATYARYLRGEDYHAAIPRRLEALCADAARDFEFAFKICCDTSAVLERSLAHLAGLGWIGKNTCLIHPRLGSYLFLAEALISEPTGGMPKPMRDHCGTCSACLLACPTAAFPHAGELDARRCLSYWTLETRGSLALDPRDARAIENRVAGCDVCQEVCPFNAKPRPDLWPEWRDASADATALVAWRELLTEDDAAYRARVSRSALAWVKPHAFRRNVALAIAACADDLDATQRADLAAAARTALDRERNAAARDALSKAIASLSGPQMKM
ncbi:tRNA epoxyqueuosine(34) reductase QueG [bacterium]|nr:tRNA epoxyqueuosine(34) reductase QueG [bacterium]